MATTSNGREGTSPSAPEPDGAPQQTGEPSEPELVRYDANGDAILVIQDKLRCLVSTKALSLASKVFAAMFSPPYLEGQSLSSEDPPIIEFPEDDPKPFGALMQILHFDDLDKEDVEGDIPQPTVSGQQIMNLLILADKYDCVAACRIAIKMMGRDEATVVEAGRKTMEPQELYGKLVDMTIISYATRDRQLFWTTSKRLLFQTGPQQSFTAAASRHGAQLVPATV